MKKLSHAAHSLVSQRGRRGNRGQNVQLHVGTLPARGSELAKGQADLISARVLKPRKRSATWLNATAHGVVGPRTVTVMLRAEQVYPLKGGKCGANTLRA